jgi:hypothetical protein
MICAWVAFMNYWMSTTDQLNENVVEKLTYNDSYSELLLLLCYYYYFYALRRLLVTTTFLVTLMMEALSSSETSVITRATRRNIPEAAILHSQGRDDLKSYIALTGWTS